MHRKLNSTSNDSAYNINFNVPYAGEDRVPYDSSYGSSKDEALFHTNLKKLMIHVVFNGQNTSFSRMSFGALSEVEDSFANSTLDSTVHMNSTYKETFRRLTIQGHTLPVKESSLCNINRLSLPTPFDETLLKPASIDPALTSITDELEDLKLDSWIVDPEELIIDANNKDKRILLKSNSNSDMRFKVEWTIDIITVSPLRGFLPANGEIGLRLTLINTNHNKLVENYHGNIKIACDGTEKIVTVKVFKDQQRTRCVSPLHSTFNDSLRSGFLGNSDFLDNTLVDPVSQYINIKNISNFPVKIDLQKTKQGVLSETVLIVGNPTKRAVSWNINPISILFVQPSDDSIDCTSSVFEFAPTSSILKSMETNNIVIQFSPQSVAHFKQFFEIALNFENGPMQTTNIQLEGEALADLSITCKARSSEVKDKRQTITVKKRVKKELFTASDICKFPDTVSGQKSTSAITIKNISVRDIKLTVIKPRLPFILSHPTCIVKSKKFIKIPIFFKPIKIGNYESEVKFICENSNELAVRLSGSCVA